MNRKIEILGILFWVRGGLAIACAPLFATVGILGYLGLLEPKDSVEDRIAGGVGSLALTVFFAAHGIAYLLVGTGLRRLRPWTRTAGLVLAILELMCCCSFPVGTALAVFTLVVLLSDDVVHLFEQQSRPV